MKNKFMRAAVILMALVLMTSCFVGGTFAKYVTEGTAKDSARVAKFGVVVSASDGAFDSEYTTDDSTYSGSVSVKSDVDVVAPGTSGNFGTIELSGKPEVAVKVTYDADVTLGSNWVDENGNYYCPIIITVDGTEFAGYDYSSATAFAEAIENKISGYTASYAPGTDLSTIENAEIAVSWKWNFEDNTHSNSQSDENDTYLGNQANATISIDLSVTVEQID